jgi:hypothetical protein
MRVILGFAVVASAGCTPSTHVAGERPQTHEVTGSLINRTVIAHMNASTDAVVVGSSDSHPEATSMSQLIGGGSPGQGSAPPKR